MGTGFTGSLEEPLKSLVQKANESKFPIFSIDVPSGLDATTGLVGNVSIEAFHTTALGFYKTGYFLEKGWNVVGKLEKVVFGLPQEKEEKAAFSFLFLQKEKLGAFLPKIVKKRHKYQTGMVLGFSGTEEMEGAASLSSLAALRSGCGMMKLFFMGKEKPKKLVPEVIVHSFSEEKVIEEELKRAKAVYIGPGIGREKPLFLFLEKLIPKIKSPLVLDADALFFLSQKESFSCKGAILTPHRKEMERLLHKEYEKEEDLIRASQRYVDTKEVILVLKGAPTFIFSPKNKPFLSCFGDPGMAKAGTGDVLTGVVASFLAQGVPSMKAAILAVVLHGISGEICAAEKSSYGFIASDLIKNLPKAFQKLLQENVLDAKK